MLHCPELDFILSCRELVARAVARLADKDPEFILKVGKLRTF